MTTREKVKAMTDEMQARMSEKRSARARRATGQMVRDAYSRKGESVLDSIARLDREIAAEQTRDAILRAGMVV